MPNADNSLLGLLNTFGAPDEIQRVEFEYGERIALIYEKLPKKPKPKAQLLKVSPTLTPTELEILRLAELGWNDDQVADELNLTVQNVRTHRRNARGKSRKGG